jgi:hypothetical protein
LSKIVILIIGSGGNRTRVRRHICNLCNLCKKMRTRSQIYGHNAYSFISTYSVSIKLKIRRMIIDEFNIGNATNFMVAQCGSLFFFTA